MDGLNRLLSKLHSVSKIAIFGIFVTKFFDHVATHVLKILRQICQKMANFFNQREFRKKSNVTRGVRGCVATFRNGVVGLWLLFFFGMCLSLRRLVWACLARKTWKNQIVMTSQSFLLMRKFFKSFQSFLLKKEVLLKLKMERQALFFSSNKDLEVLVLKLLKPFPSLEKFLDQSQSFSSMKKKMLQWDDFSRLQNQHPPTPLLILSQESSSCQCLTEQLGPIYYWIDDTCAFPVNSGIQRVVRGLARFLMGLGLDLIPVKWDLKNGVFCQPSEKELTHFAGWNGPIVSAWRPWISPDNKQKKGWVFIAEPIYPTQFQMSDVKHYASLKGLLIAAVFYDAIPCKMRGIYSFEKTLSHAEYMKGLIDCDLVLPICEFVRNDFFSFCSKISCWNPLLENRVQTACLPGEFLESKRSLTPKYNRSSKITILCVGTVEQRKNHKVLVDSFGEMLKHTKKTVELIIAGGNHVHPEYGHLINQHIALFPNIRWKKNVSEEELLALYEQCDFTVYPSLEEGFGLPILESLWHARPCICRHVGAMGEVAVGGGCLLVETADVNALADGILQLVEDGELRLQLAEAAIQRSLKTWENYAREVAIRMVQTQGTP